MEIYLYSFTTFCHCSTGLFLPLATTHNTMEYNVAPKHCSKAVHRFLRSTCIRTIVHNIRLKQYRDSHICRYNLYIRSTVLYICTLSCTCLIITGLTHSTYTLTVCVCTCTVNVQGRTRSTYTHSTVHKRTARPTRFEIA